MTNNAIDQAARVLSKHWKDSDTNEALGQQIMLSRALDNDGLLVASPQVIYTHKELAALDPDTLLMGLRDAWGATVLRAHDWLEGFTENSADFPVLAVVATGGRVRAALRALEEGTA